MAGFAFDFNCFSDFRANFTDTIPFSQQFIRISHFREASKLFHKDGFFCFVI